MLQKTERDESTSGVPLSCVSRDILEIHGHPCPSLMEREMSGIHAGMSVHDGLTGIAPPSSSARRRIARSVRLKSSNWNIRA
jgi:hypothetical protein